MQATQGNTDNVFQHRLLAFLSRGGDFPPWLALARLCCRVGACRGCEMVALWPSRAPLVSKGDIICKEAVTEAK